MPFNIKNTRFVFVRHADAATALPGQPDRDRPLTDVGQEQAQTLSGRLVYKAFDLALISPALRAQKTAEPIMEDLRPKNVVNMESLYGHPEAEIDEILGNMCLELGQVEYRVYLQHRNAGVLQTFAEHTAADIGNEVAMYHRDGFDVLVVGHHPLLNAIISSMFPLLTSDMLDYIFPKCGAVQVCVDHHGEATIEFIE